MEVKPVSDKEKQTLRNRAECIERVNTYINSIAPILIAQLETGFKLKVTGDLYDKDKTLLKGILGAVKCTLSHGYDGRKGSSAWIRADEYSIKVEVTDIYTEYGYHGESGARYSRNVYLWNHQSNVKYDFKPLPFYTGQQLIVAKERLQVVLNEVSQLNDEASSLKSLIGSSY